MADPLHAKNFKVFHDLCFAVSLITTEALHSCQKLNIAADKLTRTSTVDLSVP